MFAEVRPLNITMHKSSKSCTDPDRQRAAALTQYGELTVINALTLEKQYSTWYFSLVLPFIFPKMASGPDFYEHQRWRRTHPKAPWVSPAQFARIFARRIEAQCRLDWMALPLIRSVSFRFTAEHTMSAMTPFACKRQFPSEEPLSAYVEAAKNLHHHLHKGFIGSGIPRIPIAADTTKLPYANGLSPVENRLAHAQHFLAQHLGGTQQVRQLMGRCHFGARVVYGDCLMITISPNEQHSAMVLRLSRFRAEDPLLQHRSPEWKQIAGTDYPLLEQPRVKFW